MDDQVKISAVNKSVTVSGTMTDGAVADPSMLQSAATFSSSNEAIATVDDTGIVSTLGEGTVNIEVDVNGIKKVLEVIISAPVLETLSLSQETITVNEGDTITLTFE